MGTVRNFKGCIVTIEQLKIWVSYVKLFAKHYQPQFLQITKQLAKVNKWVRNKSPPNFMIQKCNITSPPRAVCNIKEHEV